MQPTNDDRRHPDVLDLSEGNLRSHQNAISALPVNPEFAQYRLKEEGTQAFESALADRFERKHILLQNTEELVLTVTNTYRQRNPEAPPLNVSPMQRFCFVDKKSDPQPLMAKCALDDAAIPLGSFEYAQARSNAAERCATMLEPDSDSDDGGVGDGQYRSTRQVPQGTQARVLKKPVLNKRKTSTSDVRVGGPVGKRTKLGKEM